MNPLNLVIQPTFFKNVKTIKLYSMTVKYCFKKQVKSKICPLERLFLLYVVWRMVWRQERLDNEILMISSSSWKG